MREACPIHRHSSANSDHAAGASAAEKFVLKFSVAVAAREMIDFVGGRFS